MMKGFDIVNKFIRTWFEWRDSFTTAPYASILFNVILASLLSLITNSDADLLDQGISMSGYVSGASLQIVTLTFSLTVLSVQIAAQSYSPRLLEEFLKDPVSKIVISVNLGAYAYSFTMRYFLFDQSDAPSVPYVAIHLLSVHMLLVLSSFVGFIHFFIQGFRLETILSRARDSCFNAARNLLDELDSEHNDTDLPEVPNNAYKVAADRSGYVVRFQLERVVNLAEKMDVYIRYNHNVGNFVSEDTTLAYVWDAKTTDEADSLTKRVCDNFLEAEQKGTSQVWEELVEEKLGVLVSTGVVLSKQRSGEMDVTLGIQQLSDIAMRALSPGINDPQTAIQCMDTLAVVLGRLADMKLGLPIAQDKNGKRRAWGPQRSFSYLLSLLDPIRHYGGADLSVCRRGVRLFGDLGSVLTRKHHQHRIPTVLAQMEQWLNVAKKNFPDQSPELLSVQALYDHEVEQIRGSECAVVKEDDNVTQDLQQLDITHNEDSVEEKITEDSEKMWPTKILESVTGTMPNR